MLALILTESFQLPSTWSNMVLQKSHKEKSNNKKNIISTAFHFNLLNKRKNQSSNSQHVNLEENTGIVKSMTFQVSLTLIPLR